MDVAEASVSPVGRSALARLATILVFPRRTMRAILDSPRDRSTILLVVLAIVSSIVKEIKVGEIQQAMEQAPAPFPLIVAGVLIALVLVFLFFFYAFSWIALGIGRVLEGTGTARGVRSSVAWGFAPLIWALVYRIPFAFLRTSPPEGESIFSPGSFAPDGWLVALVPLILEFVTFCWYLFVASLTLAEAHGFSGLRGLSTLLLSLASPAVLILAAVLTMVV